MSLIERIEALFCGWPMTCIEPCRFVDKVSGKSIGLYQDRTGKRWLAENRWARFRVRASDGEAGA